MSFSKRYNYDAKCEILEEAPEWLRVVYCENILREIVHADLDEGVKFPKNSLSIKVLHEKLCEMLQEEMEANDYNSLVRWQDFKDHINAIIWYQFYNFIEIVGQELMKNDSINNAKFFNSYYKNVNDFFNHNRVGWRLNEQSRLNKQTPWVLQAAVTQLEKELDILPAAKKSFKKALHYLFNACDPENCFKEVVCALESAIRKIAGKGATLGQAVKMLRKSAHPHQRIFDMIENFYIHANSQPQIRHGSPLDSNFPPAEAELCFYMGTAFLLYLTRIEEFKTLAKNNFCEEE